MSKLTTIFPAIPNYSKFRQFKRADMYETVKIDESHPLHNDLLVDARMHGFPDAQAYYSKPNNMTGEILPGIDPTPWLRFDLVKRLRKADRFLRTHSVRQALGYNCRIKIDDGLRAYETQVFAFYTAWPMALRNQMPEVIGEYLKDPGPGKMSKELEQLVTKFCAKPASHPTPTPHLTGGSVDVKLYRLDTNEEVDRGNRPGVQCSPYQDFYEGYHIYSPELSDIPPNQIPEGMNPNGLEWKRIRDARRVLHYAMTKIAGLGPNPHEIWHYGIGDPLWAYMVGECPYYGIPQLPAVDKQ